MKWCLMLMSIGQETLMPNIMGPHAGFFYVGEINKYFICLILSFFVLCLITNFCVFFLS